MIGNHVSTPDWVISGEDWEVSRLQRVALEGMGKRELGSIVRMGIGQLRPQVSRIMREDKTVDIIFLRGVYAGGNEI